MDTLDVISHSSLFRGVPPAECEQFIALARAQQTGKGTSLFRIGDPAERLFIVRLGVVELTMPLSMDEVEREVAVQEAHAGEAIGWSALVAPYRFTMNARAASDVDLLAFSTQELQAELDRRPQAGVRIAMNLARIIARRLEITQTMWTRELQRHLNESFVWQEGS